jgi:small subunit ribosomal protein S16
MSAKIKLARFGKKGDPIFRIIVIDESSKRQGRVVSQLGFYHPGQKPEKIEVDRSQVQKWLKMGAQPTASVKKILGI